MQINIQIRSNTHCNLLFFFFCLFFQRILHFQTQRGLACFERFSCIPHAYPVPLLKFSSVWGTIDSFFMNSWVSWYIIPNKSTTVPGCNTKKWRKSQHGDYFIWTNGQKEIQHECLDVFSWTSSHVQLWHCRHSNSLSCRKTSYQNKYFLDPIIIIYLLQSFVIINW